MDHVVSYTVSTKELSDQVKCLLPTREDNAETFRWLAMLNRRVIIVELPLLARVLGNIGEERLQLRRIQVCGAVVTVRH